MNTALVVACISGVVALASAGLSAWTQQQVMKQEKQGRAEERRSDAKVVLDRYRGPLLDAAWQLGDRLDSIRHRGFLSYLSEGSGRERDAKLTALFRFAHYFGWREFVRTEVQLLRFENEEDTRSAAGFLNDVAEVLASDLLDGKWAMLWNDEQRGIGELMTERPSGTAPIVRGHAAFYRDYDKTFAPWMERFAGDLLSTAALSSDRLRLLQWALYGLVRQLDEEGTYGGVWIDRSASEIRRPAQHGSFTQHEEQLRRHLAAIEPSTFSLPWGSDRIPDQGFRRKARSEALLQLGWDRFRAVRAGCGLPDSSQPVTEEEPMPYLGSTRSDLCSICAADSDAEYTGAARGMPGADSDALADDDSLAPPARDGDRPSGTGGAWLVTGHSGQQTEAGR